MSVLFLSAVAGPGAGEPEITSMELPNRIFVGQNLNISVTLTGDDVYSVILRLEIDNNTHPIALDYKDGNWEKSIPNLEEGEIEWELLVNNIVTKTGIVRVTSAEDDGPQWPLLIIAVFFILTFVVIEMAFKPARRMGGRKKEKQNVDEPGRRHGPEIEDGQEREKPDNKK
ncbi:MAG: hypothetical protein KAS67_05310 [Thermoplasmata archaeon]|nr:hypothetical protein [Thermoplasmata archaeon]